LEIPLINSHIIPAFYLERFARPSTRGPQNPGRICVYEKGKEPDDRATSAQGRENGYFAYIAPDGTVEESFETVLAKRESECNNVLELAKSELYHWPSGSEEKLALYAALLFRRATQQRSFSDHNWQKTVDEIRQAVDDPDYIRQFALDLTCQGGVPVTEKILRDSIINFVEDATLPKSAGNNFISDLMDHVERGAQQLLNKRPWRVLRPPDGMEFVTSDNPLVTFVPLGHGVLHPGYGFNKEYSDAAFPLASNACLLMGHAWNVPKLLDKTSLDQLNDALISVSDRYVYSKTPSREIQDRVDQYGGSSRYGVNAFVPVGIKIPVARQFLRAHFGLED
jgi:Protein of unknown function (DUF4238)